MDEELSTKVLEGSFKFISRIPDVNPKTTLKELIESHGKEYQFVLQYDDERGKVTFNVQLEEGEKQPDGSVSSNPLIFYDCYVQTSDNYKLTLQNEIHNEYDLERLEMHVESAYTNAILFGIVVREGNKK